LVLSITDSNFFPLFSTADPRGTDSLFILSLLGQEIYEPDGFNLSVTEESNPVPEPNTLLLISIGIFIFIPKKKKFLKWGIFSLTLFAYLPAHAALMNVTSQVVVDRSPLVYNRATKTFDGLVSINNVGSNNLESPMFLVVSGLPDNVSVYNATSLSPDGKPMLDLQLDSSGLPSGQSIQNFRIKFHNPNNLKFTAILLVLANDGTLPPDPGDMGKVTLEGVDSNTNGIRDDLEIYIDVNFGTSQKKREALNQLAQSLQQGIIATTEQESMNAANSFSRSMECLEYIDSENQEWKSVQSKAVDTPERLDAWLSHETRISGKVFPIRPLSEWKTSCSFDIDALDN